MSTRSEMGMCHVTHHDVFLSINANITNYTYDVRICILYESVWRGGMYSVDQRVV